MQGAGGAPAQFVDGDIKAVRGAENRLSGLDLSRPPHHLGNPGKVRAMARKGIKLAGGAGTRLLDAGTHNPLLEAGQFMATVERTRARYLLDLLAGKNF